MFTSLTRQAISVCTVIKTIIIMEVLDSVSIKKSPTTPVSLDNQGRTVQYIACSTGVIVFFMLSVQF